MIDSILLYSYIDEVDYVKVEILKMKPRKFGCGK
jgi:hypothetical protein